MIPGISIALAAYEAWALATGHRTITNARGLARVGIAAWWVILGAHLLYEWTADDIGQKAAENFT